ncbi:LacI family DNA-binding transcriptional regulator [Sporolactobacillus laevolacticus]|uniref:Catabolite control protein A n=1 Tax=Sporolactobacillus laevolacticus DSM 442 TaxID=1395513 RepID=V6J592_9BACL|nr:LacI family DNA-binding transcriptional regulator [Sporolactobacillus laevolacticus]EST11889.1 sucrose operon repressor [Sporolactobacillus laevolacticus DSM 442]
MATIEDSYDKVPKNKLKLSNVYLFRKIEKETKEGIKIVVTLKDVAERAGVSITTVSRVINNYGSLSEKTINKVHEAMKELNYQPNSLARGLQGKPSKIIGVIFPDVSNIFAGELVKYIEWDLFKAGYKMILCSSADDIGKERDYLRMLQAHQVAGVISAAIHPELEEYKLLNAPIVSFDRYLAQEVPIVGSDNYSGGKIATEALIQSGARKIGMITGLNRSNSPTKKRMTSFIGTVEASGLTPYLLKLEPHTSELLKRMEIKNFLLNNQLEGVFTDDLTALEVMNLAEELAIPIPKELKIVGYDGTTFIRKYFPKLTTVKVPLKECVELLVNILIKRIEHPDYLFENNYTLPVSLHRGETC